MSKSEDLSSMDILVLMLNTEANRFNGCEPILDILCQAAIMKSVESVAESWISVLERHSSKIRNLSDDSIQAETTISVNGPLVQHCDSVVKGTMTTYWRRMKIGSLQSGHFVRRSNNVMQYVTSKSVDRLNDAKVKTPFMT